MGDGVGAVFTALADPSRRTIVERLATAGRATPTELAGELPMTRQAVAKHLATLEQAGLVHARREGRSVVYRPDPQPLRDATAWMNRMGAEWDARLEALARHVADPAPGAAISP